MPTVKKIIEKMKAQPHGVRFEEAEKVLRHHGYRLVRQKGSHRKYRKDSFDLITIKSPLTASYVEDILERIGEK